MNHNPKDVLYEVAKQAYEHACCTDSIPAPGESYARLPQATRDVLAKLKSEDVATIRWDYPSLGDFIHRRREARR